MSNCYLTVIAAMNACDALSWPRNHARLSEEDLALQDLHTSENISDQEVRAELERLLQSAPFLQSGRLVSALPSKMLSPETRTCSRST